MWCQWSLGGTVAPLFAGGGDLWTPRPANQPWRACPAANGAARGEEDGDDDDDDDDDGRNDNDDNTDLPGLIDRDDDADSDDGDDDSVEDPDYDPAEPEEEGMEDPDKLIDLLRLTEHLCNRLLLEAYDDAIHCNPRKHLYGGMAADERMQMQMLYGEVIATLHPLYSPRGGLLGRS